jgi:hypothetical protein
LAHHLRRRSEHENRRDIPSHVPRQRSRHSAEVGSLSFVNGSFEYLTLLSPSRNARHFTGGHQVLDIYDSQLGMLRIGPFNYDPVRGVDLWLSQSDEFILQHLSTSPEVEPPHFVMQVRATLKYIQDNQFPGEFPANLWNSFEFSCFFSQQLSQFSAKTARCTIDETKTLGCGNMFVTKHAIRFKFFC